MSDFLIVLDDLINDYVTFNPNTRLTQNIISGANIYGMFAQSVSSSNIVICQTEQDLYNELIKRNIQVEYHNGHCYKKFGIQRMVMIRGWGDFTNYINCGYVKKHKRLHRDALARFFKFNGVLSIKGKLITDRKKLKTVL